jgi:simple sugar transport system permease protein
MNNKKLRKLLNTILIPILAILSGLVLMGIMIALTGKPVWESYVVLFSKAFGCQKIGNCAIITTLERATPIILTGLAAVVAFSSGMFSIGQEGQYLMAAVVAAWLGYAIHLPNVIHQTVILVACMAAGALYGFIPGFLRVKLGVNELLSTIVLNAVATLFIEYMVQFPLRGDKSTTAHSPVIDQTAQLPSFLPGAKWGVGFVIAVIAVIVIYIYLWKTKGGYEQRMAGQSHYSHLTAAFPAAELPSAPCSSAVLWPVWPAPSK